VPVGDEDALLAALDAHGHRLAAVLLDAMPNRAGPRPASEDHVALVRRETERRGILLIADEVLTFRVARGGLHSLYGLRPDLVTLGKLIGGGLPVGAVGGREDVETLAGGAARCCACTCRTRRNCGSGCTARAC
jgi:glutamate-1-semialdehyde 2,1-aminomutase